MWLQENGDYYSSKRGGSQGLSAMPKKNKASDHLQLNLDIVPSKRNALDVSPYFVNNTGSVLSSYSEQGFPNGALFTGDCVEWMKTIRGSSVDLVFADPPYSIKKAEWDNFESQEKYIEWSMRWIEQAARILKPTGSLYICGFSEILSDLKHPAMRYFKSCRWLIWFYRNKANLGKDWGRSHESILHLRKASFTHINTDEVRIPYSAHTLKYPDHPQADTSQYGHKGSRWIPNPSGAKPKDVIEIPTTCNGMNEKTPHPTQKPEELLRTLVLAASNRDDMVLDPFSGSGTTAVVATQLHRRWLACDQNSEYNKWATHRLDSVDRARTIEQWKAFDRRNYERRRSIR